MKKRSPVAVVVLSIVTFGVYDIYWLVKTKKVLNEKTKFHTPTIWLLIVPWVILTAGYTVLFTASIMADLHSSSNTSGSTDSSSTTEAASGEQLNQKGERRPSQYLHICSTADNLQYVSQGNPKCLIGDSFQTDYSPSVPGTVYSSPCKTTSGTLRYVYVSSGEGCPSGTRLVFYNSIGGTAAELSTSPSVTTSNASNDQTTPDTGLSIAALALIAVGFIASFITSIFWFFQFSKAINEYTRGKMSTAVTFLILWLIHLIGVALIQDTFNDMEDDGTVAGNPMAPPLAGAVFSHSPPVEAQPSHIPQPQHAPHQPIEPATPPPSPEIHHHKPEHRPPGHGHETTDHTSHSEPDSSNGRGDRT